MEQEIWKDVIGYEGLYQVSNYGRILKLPCENKFGNHYVKWPQKYLKPKDNGRGYLIVAITLNRVSKNKYIHRLVAEAFIIKPKGKTQINHIDGIKANNRVDNLEWCTNSENNIHAYKIGLMVPSGACAFGRIDPKRKGVYKLLLSGEIIEEYNSIMDAAFKNNVNTSRISRVCNGKNYIVHGFTYKFKE